MNFRWISQRALMLLHDESLAIHGGLSGVRDEGLLLSALARPVNLLAYGTPDVADCAASYAYGLATNHPVADGNKRAAFLALGMFLRLNGYRLAATQSDATQTIFALAAGDLTESELAAWIRAHATPLS